MNIPSKVRGWLYIGLALASMALAVVIVLFGWVTEDQVLSIIALAVSLYGAIVGMLARFNLTPDDDQ